MQKMHFPEKNHQLQSWNNEIFLFWGEMYILITMVTLFCISPVLTLDRLRCTQQSPSARGAARASVVFAILSLQFGSSGDCLLLIKVAFLTKTQTCSQMAPTVTDLPAVQHNSCFVSGESSCCWANRFWPLSSQLHLTPAKRAYRPYRRV